MEWHDLEAMKVDELRTLAKEKAGLEGVTALDKDHLVPRVADALGIARPHKVVDAGEKREIKARIRSHKQERDRALREGDRAALRRARRGIRAGKRKLRRMARVAG